MERFDVGAGRTQMVKESEPPLRRPLLELMMSARAMTVPNLYELELLAMKARMESAPIEVDRIGCVCVRMARIVIIEHHLHNHVTRRRDHQWTAVAHGPTCCERGERLQGHEIVRIGGLLSIIAVVVGDDEDPVLRVFERYVRICGDHYSSRPKMRLLGVVYLILDMRPGIVTAMDTA